MINNIKSLLALVLLLGTQVSHAQNDKDRPNVLMICIDDMNDWVGFLGGHPQTKTPNMDKLASKGVNFEKAYCTSPGCSPSRNALMFGVEPSKSGLYPFYNINNIEGNVLDKYTAMPKTFRDNGYETVGLTKVFHNPDNKYKQEELWDEYKYYGNKKLNVIKEKGYYPEPYNKRTVACPASNPLEDFQDYRSAMHAVKYLEKDHDKPFFLAVGFVLPHTSFIMPEENFDRFKDPIEAPEIKANDLTDIPLVGRSNAQIYVEIPVQKDHAWEDVRRGYLASINFTDDNVGRVLDALEKSAYADNTIVVLWSDHGFHLGEKRTFSKFSLWEEATRTPFIIYDARGQKGNGKSCKEPVGLINVYKTLCDLAGIKEPDYVDGISLAPWLKKPGLEKESPAMTTWGRGNYTLRTKEWRYTRYHDGSQELYNELQDPNEWTNLADDPKYAAMMEKLADKWLPKTEAPQIPTGRELYNVSDADQKMKTINQFKKNVRKYNELELQPPLGDVLN
ncbi:sulfatase [Flammeovirga agarivorans]|uniref:Sulfatase n=1 Tax=Flammeovirga agarivorans TaxID=2726742 RepID=A0A7X8XY71_9BACT|nr:sulfatase [Flammeovirga agarivorans]NLR93949.1 sulfatase [Flammeovirga agarivorans]